VADPVAVTDSEPVAAQKIVVGVKEDASLRPRSAAASRSSAPSQTAVRTRVESAAVADFLTVADSRRTPTR
jgi:hypothetical protein